MTKQSRDSVPKYMYIEWGITSTVVLRIEPGFLGKFFCFAKCQRQIAILIYIWHKIQLAKIPDLMTRTPL